MAVLPLATTLTAVVAIRLAQGVAEAAFFVGGFALLADLAPPERLGEAISYNSLGLYLGFALGPPLGEWAYERAGSLVAWLVAAGLGAVAVVLVAALTEPPRDPGDDGGHGQLIHRPSIPVSLAFLASLMAVSGFLAFGALHADRVGLENAGVAMLAYGMVVVVCRLGFARVPDRVPALPLAAGSLATVGVGLVVMAALPTPAGFLRRGGDVGRGRVRDPGAVHRDLRHRPALRAGRRVGDGLGGDRPRLRSGPDPARAGGPGPRHPDDVRRRRRHRPGRGRLGPAARPGASVLGGTRIQSAM